MKFRIPAIVVYYIYFYRKFTRQLKRSFVLTYELSQDPLYFIILPLVEKNWDEFWWLSYGLEKRLESIVLFCLELVACMDQKVVGESVRKISQTVYADTETVHFFESLKPKLKQRIGSRISIFNEHFPAYPNAAQ